MTSLNQTIQIRHWDTLQKTVFTLILALFCGGLGFGGSFLLPKPWLASLAAVNIAVILALFITRLLKTASRVQWSLLILVSLLAGLATALIQNTWEIVAGSIVSLSINFLILAGIAGFAKAEFKRFNLLLACLAITFSFVGIILIFAQGTSGLRLVWTSAAFICLDIMLYNLLQKILRTEAKDYFSMTPPLILLHIALSVNLLLALSALLP